MDAICMTRGIKNIEYIRRRVPRPLSEKSLKELLSLPPETLFHLHRIDPRTVIKSKELLNFFSKNKLPIPIMPVSHPLFNGTLVFVQITFNRAGQLPFSMSDADTQTAVSYATRAIGCIHAYALQYGPNTVNVSQGIIKFSVNLAGDTFSDADLQGWIDTIVTNNNLANACIMVLIDIHGPRNTMAMGRVGGYHFITRNQVPYCFCNVKDVNLTVNDAKDVYALVLSHEIAEMVVDPQADGFNPEVCDACAGNCGNRQNIFFDNDDNFIGGSNKVPPQFPFTYFIDGVIQRDFIDPGTNCAVSGSNPRSVCVYPPPPVWSSGVLTTVPNLHSVSGHYSSGDQRHLAIVGTKNGKVHEIFWKSGQQGIEGEDDLPVGFNRGSIIGVSSLYNSNDQRHVVIVGTAQGKIHEIFWKSTTVGIEGHDDLPVHFIPGSIVGVSGFYNSSDQRHVVIVGTAQGKIHEIFWKSTTVGIEGHDDLPVNFVPGSIVGVSGLYNSSDQRHVVVVATTQGKIREIFWKSNTVGIEGQDDLPVSFHPGTIIAVSGFYSSADQRHVVLVATTDGNVYQIYWKSGMVGIDCHGPITQLTGSSIVSLGGFYSENDQFQHAIVGTADGKVHELWAKSLPA